VRLTIEHLEGRVVPAVLDLSGSAGLSGTINGAIFSGASVHNETVGSGTIDSFVRLQEDGVEQGYNTDARPYQSLNNADTTATFDHSVRLSDLPVVIKGSTAYYEFVLDINQKSNLPYLSLDELRLYVTTSATPTPNALNSYDPVTHKLNGLSPVYDMGNPVDATSTPLPNETSVWLNASFNSGSGNGLDMFLDVPIADFGTDLSQYVYLYSKFGTADVNDIKLGGTADAKNGGSADDGFEEWARGKQGPLQLNAQVATSIDGTGVTSMPDGSSVFDTATVTPSSSGFPTPTGTVTYYFYDTNTPIFGTTMPVSTKTVAIGNGLVPDSQNTGALTPGSYSFIATYSGDSIYIGTKSTIEPLTVNGPTQFPTEITTNASETANGVVGSAILSDSATLSGSGPTPGGTITFKLYAPDNTVADMETITVTGFGTYSTANTVTAAQIGTYEWVASYSGDTNGNLPSSTNFGDEPLSVVPASPTVVTTANPNGSVTLGTTSVTLNDSADLEGGYNPTGTITFTLTYNGSTVVDTETATVSGNGTYSTPTGYTLPTSGMVTGGYVWTASYGGDTNNNTASDNGDSAAEQVTLSKANPTLQTTPGPTVALGSGVTLTDSATLAGGFHAGGTILFTLTAPDGTTVVDTETVVVNGDGTYSTPTGFVPTGAGTYQWVASYSGDANNNPIAGEFGDEPETVNPASPQITTCPGDTVVLGSGSPLTDSATLFGGYKETGTITFTLYAPDGTTVVDTEPATVNGDGTYSIPTGFIPTAPGTYQWVASYGGDANNNPVAGNLGDEPEIVSKASPTITTVAGDSVVLGSGSALTDSATLSGSFNSGGTITFTLIGPGGTTVDTKTVPVDGDGTYPTPTGFVPTGAGTYQWIATYSGDANNNAVATKFGDEPESVTPASPAISTQASDGGVVGSVTLTDSAMLSGGFNPGGAITFTLTAPDGTTVVDTETVIVSGNGTYSTPNGVIPKVTGTYQWLASYSGDTNNSPIAGELGDEPVLVVAASPTITTTAGGSVVVGSGAALTDSATLSGAFNAGGTITFTLTAPDGTTVVDTEPVSVTGNGTYSTPSGFIPTGSGVLTGTYQWVASYSGDDNNNPIASKMGDEPETVVAASPTIITTAGGSVVVGSGTALTDSATLSGGFNPGGTITFTLTAPDGTTVVDTETVPVTGNGTYSTPSGFTPSGPGTLTGTYQWVASYSGDGNNNAVASEFDDEPETVVADDPSITTQAGGSIVVGSGAALTDSATLSGGFSPSGTIKFTLTAPNGSIVDTETVAVNGDGSYNTPTGFVPTGTGTLTGTYQWVASYSGDGNNSPIATKIGDEPEAVTKASPAIATQPSAGGAMGSVVLKDSATLSGGYLETGSIVFKLFGPGGAVKDTETVLVSGDGTYSTPKGLVPLLPGTWQWVASYSGDANNNPVAGIKGQEPVTVTKANTTIATHVLDASGNDITNKSRDAGTTGLVAHDTSLISGLVSGVPITGTVTFEFFTNATCSGAPTTTEVVPVTTVASASAPKTLPAGFYSYMAIYSGDSNYKGSMGVCEPFAVTSTISGIKFNDHNGNGIRDVPADGGLAGWQIKLDGVVAATTDVNGLYKISGVGPGTHTVQEVPQTGWQQTKGGPGAGSVYTISTGLDSSGNDFGNFKLITISGTKFEDHNGNGVRNLPIDEGLQGWQIKLDGVIAATTDANGAYSISGVGPGVHTVQEVNQAGWTQTLGGPGYSVVASSGSDVAGVNFGNFQQVTISGTVWEDHNGSESRDPSDQGLQGWHILLDGHDVATTDASGNYTITGVGPGTHNVREVLQTGWTETFGPSTGYFVITTSGTNVSGKDFGNFKNVTFTGVAFEDHNGNTVRDLNDQGLSGWQILLDGAVAATTDGNGIYHITNVGPEVHKLQIVRPSGWSGTLGAISYSFATTSGVDMVRNFGNFKNVTFSGIAFEDHNGNSILNPGDQGLGGWHIKLDGLDMATTAPDGSYSISGIGAGIHKLQEVNQAGFTVTQGLVGYAFATTSGVNMVRNFGDFKNFTISGVVFYDSNANSLQDIGEKGLAGWTIRVVDGNNKVLQGITGANGSYTIANVGPGVQSVTEVPTAAWSQLSATPAPFTALSGVNVSGDNFGNALLGQGGGQSFTFWENTANSTLFNASTVDSLNLVNSDGSAFNPTTYAQFRTWLMQSGLSGNDAYQLSAQLAMTALNAFNHFIDPNAYVYAGGIPESAHLGSLVNSRGYVQVQALMDTANAFLGNPVNDVTVISSPARTYEEALKLVLAAVNSNWKITVLPPP
jgi:hypothetical protein